MAFDFPTTPAVDDVFEDAVSGAAYVWVGTKWWRTKSAANPNPVPPPPIVSSLAPNSAIVGESSPVLVRVRGGVYSATSAVQVNGVSVPTTFVSASELTFSYTIPAGAAVAQIGVRNPDGQVSGTKPFTVTLTPHQLLSLSPNSFFTTTTPNPVTITATGNQFTAASVISVNDVAVATTFVSDTALTFSYPIPSAAKIDQVKVTTGTEISATLPLKTEVPTAPTILRFNPLNASKAAGTLQLTIEGSGFMSDSVGQDNGVALTTTYQSSQFLLVALPPPAGADVTSEMTVRNPSANNAVSAIRNFIWTP